jgi:hypothetical protein
MAVSLETDITCFGASVASKVTEIEPKAYFLVFFFAIDKIGQVVLPVIECKGVIFLK